MSWNYRVIRSRNPNERWLVISEVYYKADGVTPKAFGSASAPFSNEGDDEADMKSLRWSIDKMREALDKPILDEDDFRAD